MTRHSPHTTRVQWFQPSSTDCVRSVQGRNIIAFLSGRSAGGKSGGSRVSKKQPRRLEGRSDTSTAKAGAMYPKRVSHQAAPMAGEAISARHHHCQSSCCPSALAFSAPCALAVLHAHCIRAFSQQEKDRAHGLFGQASSRPPGKCGR